MKIKKVLKMAGISLLAITMMQGNSLFGKAATNSENTEPPKVAVDSSVVIAKTEKYKNVDYSFLNTYDYGASYDTNRIYNTVQDLSEANLKSGACVRTKGYYEEGDLGAACYLIGEKEEAGAIKLVNGLYANIQPDIYTDQDGTNWLVCNVRQFGAKGDGIEEDEDSINAASTCVGKLVNSDDNKNSYDRGLIYLPNGQYKIANQVSFSYSNLNFVGAGDDSVLFTDNDYRDEEGYDEFLFTCWGANNMFFGDFRIEAREVDLYHYMRQFVILYSDTVYLHQVDLIIPQSTYGSYYFEDKQYSNFCCYTGNKNITVDDCNMEQMSGTYRGANIGVLDIWSAGEENITIMNCELYGNARDEQVGFFSKNDENASVKHVNFINNTMHSVQLKYVDIIGNRTMCFSIAYADSKNVEDIRVAGNHFICESDSKFMTFGTLKNCRVENNIIEIKCTYATWSMLFDSSNQSAEDIKINHNDIYITSDDGKGRGNVTGGKLVLSNNRIFTDVDLSYGVLGPEIRNNEIIALNTIGIIGENSNIVGNTIRLYKGLGSVGTNRNQVAAYGGAAETDYSFSDNKVYDYLRCTDYQVFRSLLKLDGDFNKLTVSGNAFYFPNTRFITSSYSASEKFTDGMGTYYKNVIFRRRSGNYKEVIVKDNVFQNVEEPKSDSIVKYERNQLIEPEEDLNEALCSSVKVLYKGKELTNLTTTEDSIQLSELTYVAVSTDEEGKVTKEKEIEGKEVHWYTSSEKMASISKDGKLKRNMYGTVSVYAVPADGSGVWAKADIHFARSKAAEVVYKEREIQLQPGLKYYMEYEIRPTDANQKLMWSSSDEDIVAVDQNGVLTGISIGSAVITGTTTDGSGTKASIPVNVGEVTVKKVNMKNSYVYFKNSEIGTTKKLEIAGYVPENAQNKGIGKWVSNNEDVVVVDDAGVITAKGPGKTTIYAYSKDNKCYGATFVYVQPGKLTNYEVESCTNSTVKLKWDRQPEVKGYFIYQWNEETSQWDTFNGGNPINSNLDFYTIEGLKEETEYKFNVVPYIMRWEVGTPYENYMGEDNIIHAKTLNYIPVNKINIGSEVVSLPLGIAQEFGGTYNPSDANYNGLKIGMELEDSTLLDVKDSGTKNGRFQYTLEGKKYGYTKMKLRSSDEIGKEVTIPVGVVAKDMVPTGEENMHLTADSKGVNVEFTGLKNEEELVKAGGMTGYMVQRSTSVAYKSVGYIPAGGLEKYVYKDTSVEPGKQYHYTVSLCSKYEDELFAGYSNGAHYVTTPEEVSAERVQLDQNVYCVHVGEQIRIAAILGPKNVSNTKLQWVSSEQDVAEVEREDVERSKENMDYANIIGKRIGVAQVYANTLDQSELSAKATIVVTPDKVNGVTTTNKNGKIQLSWEAKENVSGYYVYRYDSEGDKWCLLKDTKEVSVVDENTRTGETATYIVVAYYKYDGVNYEGQQSDKIDVTRILVPGEKDVLTTLAPTKTETVATDGAIVASSNGIQGSQIVPNTGASVTLKGYEGIYDGVSHPAVEVVNAGTEDEILYSVDGMSWSKKVPMVMNVADSKTIFVRLIRASKSYDASVPVKISPVDLSTIPWELSKTRYDWDGKKHYPTLKGKMVMHANDYTINYLGADSKIGRYILQVVGQGNYVGNVFLSYKIAAIKGHVYKVNGYKYKVLSSSKVAVLGSTNKNRKTVKINDTVSIGGKKFKITKIMNAAFKGYKKLRKVVIGKNVTVIGSKAFWDDVVLDTIRINCNNLKKVDKQILKKGDSILKVYVKSKNAKKIKKILLSSIGSTKVSIQ